MGPRIRYAAIFVLLIAGALAVRWLHPLDQGKAMSLTPAPRAVHYVLAVNWLEGYCASQPTVPQCQNVAADEQTRFALHGLWPDEQYCGVSDDVSDTDKSGQWSQLPAVTLTDAHWTALRQAMPGTQSDLERHEWLAHGTCAHISADNYFARAAALLEQVDASPFRATFAARAHGAAVTSADIRTAFDTAFGKGAGQRVKISCKTIDGHSTIDGIEINLSGDVLGKGQLKALIAAARPVPAGCDSGLVD